MKKCIIGVLIFILILPLSGCSRSQEAPAVSNSNGTYALNLESGIPGSVSFEENVANTVSVDFITDGQEKNLVLEDENGLTWTLTIPSNALAGEQTITISAMKNINSSLGALSGGIVLKPDGLKFIVPATLSVKGNNIEKSGFVFSGNGDGGNLEFSEADRKQDSIDIQLYHFSTVFAAPPSGEAYDKYTRAADNQRKSAEAAAKELLKKPVNVPVPPSISLICHHDTEAQDDFVLDIFIEEFNKQELEIVNALISSARSHVLLTGDEYDPDYSLEIRLLNRLMNKAETLMDKYMDQEDRYIPVVRAALAAEKKFMLLAGSSGDAKSLLPKVAKWAKEIADKFLKELTENHEYKNIHPVIKIAREAALLGSNMDGVLEELQKALSFKIEYKNDFYLGIDRDMHVEVKGEAQINFMYDQNNAPPVDGTCKYTNFEVIGLEDDFKMVMDNMSDTFPIKLGIENFMPCKSDTFDICIDRFGAESESITLTVPEIPAKTKTSPGFVHKATSDLFEDKKQDSIYKFGVNLKNGQKNAAEQNFSNSSDIAETTITLKLIHTPE